MSDHILSLAEISTIEAAGALGGGAFAAPAFATALAALKARWAAGLRDSETATRLLFAIHNGHTEQPQYTGVEPRDLPAAEQVLAEVGGEAALPADALFALGLFLTWSGHPFGDETAWRSEGRRWVESAATREPGSLLFREWRFFLGEAETTVGAKIYIAPEVHARYHGRGAFGTRLVEFLIGTLWPAGQAGWPPGA